MESRRLTRQHAVRPREDEYGIERIIGEYLRTGNDDKGKNKREKLHLEFNNIIHRLNRLTDEQIRVLQNNFTDAKIANELTRGEGRIRKKSRKSRKLRKSRSRRR